MLSSPPFYLLPAFFLSNSFLFVFDFDTVRVSKTEGCFICVPSLCVRLFNMSAPSSQTLRFNITMSCGGCQNAVTRICSKARLFLHPCFSNELSLSHSLSPSCSVIVDLTQSQQLVYYMSYFFVFSSQVSGVNKVVVSLEKQEALVTCDSSVTPEAIQQALSAWAKAGQKQFALLANCNKQWILL